MQKGTIIAGRFEVLATAAKGAMGVVYRARDLTDSKIVALKVLALDGPLDVTRFARESAVLATVRHVNIVNYVAHGQAGEVHFLAAEWIDGVTLASHLGTVGMTIGEAITLATGVAAALAATHALGVVHRDIKPSNIILDGGSIERVKVVDFGVARRIVEAGVLTQMGVMVGTPSYMAPEQALGILTIDPAADVWSLGCVLYQAMSGRTAFTGSTPMAIRAKVLIGAPVPITVYCPEAPPELVALIDDMLMKDPRKRLTNGIELSARLQALPAMPIGGPRHRAGPREAATVVLPVQRKTDVACFLFVAPPEADPDQAPDRSGVAAVAERHAMSMHVFEDGSVLLSAKHLGKAGAIGAAIAARELLSEGLVGAVSVFGQALTDTADTAIDRGAVLLERAVMSSLFGLPADHGESVVYVDDVIADLIADEFRVVATDQGPVLSWRSASG